MKRIFFTFLYGMLILSIYGQDLDERDLIGKWETVDSIGSFRCNLSSYSFPSENIEYLDLYEFRRNGDDSCGIVKCSVYKETYHFDEQLGFVSDGWSMVPCYGNINSWFISNGNKLHLICKSRADLRYVIKQLDNNNLVLETYDGKGQLTMKRVNENESKISVVTTDKQSDDTFTLEGIKVEGIMPGKVNIISGKKIIIGQRTVP